MIKTDAILTINAGSSSIKYKVFAKQTNKLLLFGIIEGIAEECGQWHHHTNQLSTLIHHFANHQDAFTALAKKLHEELQKQIIVGVGHRVVHGGKKLWHPTLITAQVLQDIQSLAPLAPLHNPINAEGIVYAQKHFKEAIGVAVFDTGFHHSMPEHTRYYAIDRNLAEHYSIQRYGFHGINHEYVVNEAARFLKKPLSACHFISLHLGNGASACLVKHGQSVDTSMGMTPLAGLIMGTRCGDIDPAIPLYLVEQGQPISDVDHLLNKRSGLKGLANENDMRKLLERVDLGDQNAILAIEMYTYAIQKIIGAYLSQLPSLDALIFTGGVGEHSAIIREKILSPLQHFGFILDKHLNTKNQLKKCALIAKRGIKILVVSGDEEYWIAQQVKKYLS